MKKSIMKKPNNFNYCGFLINAPYIVGLSRKYGKHDAERMIFWCVQYCLYKLARGIKIELIKVIQSGLHSGWVWKLIASEFESKDYIASWIDAEIYKKPQKKDDRLGICPECKGRKMNWKTKTRCLACDGSGRKIPDSIGEILKEIGV